MELFFKRFLRLISIDNSSESIHLLQFEKYRYIHQILFYYTLFTSNQSIISSLLSLSPISHHPLSNPSKSPPSHPSPQTNQQSPTSLSSLPLPPLPLSSLLPTLLPTISLSLPPHARKRVPDVGFVQPSLSIPLPPCLCRMKLPSSPIQPERSASSTPSPIPRPFTRTSRRVWSLNVCGKCFLMR